MRSALATQSKSKSKTKTTDVTQYCLRETPVVIRYRNYNPGDDVDSYMREQVLRTLGETSYCERSTCCASPRCGRGKENRKIPSMDSRR